MPLNPPLKTVPLLLTALRALLAPVVVAFALYDPQPAAFAFCLVVASLSDVFDGVLARRHCESAAARQRSRHALLRVLLPSRHGG